MALPAGRVGWLFHDPGSARGRGTVIARELIY